MSLKHSYQKVLLICFLGLWLCSPALARTGSFNLKLTHDRSIKKHSTQKQKRHKRKSSSSKTSSKFAAKLPVTHPERSSDFFRVIDLEGAGELGKISKELAPYRKSHGVCMRWVRLALQRWRSQYHNDARDCDFAKGATSQGRSAEAFKEWAQKNPDSLCKDLGLADVSHFPALGLPEGAILLYGKGQCNFSKRYGHAEIVADTQSSQACSDHCRPLAPRGCTADMVLVPVQNCDWLRKGFSS